MDHRTDIARPAHRARLAAVLFLVLALLVVPGAPSADAAAVPGGHVNGDAQMSASHAQAGPATSAVRWQHELSGHGFNPNFQYSAMLLDDAGHLLLHVGAADFDDEPDLVALDPQDGSIAWTRTGVSESCRAVASDQGAIFVLDAQTATIVELEASSGQPTGRTITPTPDDLIANCFRMVLADDGTLLVAGSANLYAFDITGVELSQRWSVPDADSPVVSSDGSTVYVGASTGAQFSGDVEVRALQLADGAERDRLPVPNGSDLAEVRLHATDDGVLASTPTDLVGIHDSGAALTASWSTSLGGGDGRGFSVVDGQAIGSFAAGGDRAIHAVDLALGAEVWSADVDAPRVVTGAAGNSYVAGEHGVISLDAQGQQRWQLDAAAVQPGATLDIGPIGPDGTLYAVAYQPGTGTDLPEPPIVVAIGGGSTPPPPPGILPPRIGTGDDAIEAALDISRDTFGAGSAEVVVLGRDDEFADNLAGAALAGLPVGDGDGVAGPLLFTHGGPDGQVPETVVDETVRVLGPAADCATGESAQIIVLGGVQAVSDDTMRRFEDAGYCAQRLAGETRVETAVAIAERIGGQTPPQVLLARSDDWADSATGGAYAAATGAPVLVTPSDGLPAAVEAYLDSVTPGEIVLLGGPAALSDAVAEQAASHAPVRRVAGATRDLTAIAIARDLWGDRAAAGVMLVPGFAEDGWVYALAGGVRSARDAWPQLYTQAEVLTGSARDHLAATGAEILVLGPPERISDDVAAAAVAAGDG